MPTLSGSRRFQQLRTISGVVLFAYVLMHMLNTSLGLASLQAMDRWRWILSWQFPGGWIVLLTAALVHSAHALCSLYERRVLRMPAWQFIQLLLGLSIPFLLVDHALATRAVAELYGVNPNYALVQLTYWRLAPHLGVLQSVVMIVSWVHGCMGLHFWLRLRPWYRAVAPGLFTLAVLIPTLALLGFVVSGRALLVETQDPAVISLIIANARIPGPQSSAFVSETGLMFRCGFAALIGLTLAARVVRNLLSSRFGTFTLSYADGRVVTLLPGASILEMSRAYGVPHASVCGGRGRCSTCRVLVLEGGDRLPPPHPTEAAALHRIAAPPGVRLACQIRPSHGLTVRLLIQPRAAPATAGQDAYCWGVEQRITIMFADLRGFTRLAERLYAFDSVFLLNRYFAVMEQAIQRRGGVVDKFLGDGIMALFGATSTPERGSRDALLAAGTMLEALEGLNAEFQTSLPEPLRMGIGIHLGPAVLGRVGGGRAPSLTALGDSVNIASRLESLNKEFGSVLVASDAAVRASGLTLPAAEVREVSLRGRAEPLRVHVVQARPALMEAATSTRVARMSRE